MSTGKDPAALFYIDNWLTSTAEMDADTRGWYLNLILHQYDKGDLPNDIERLAVLANVRISEYERFKQVFEQVLKQKFQQKSNNRLSNPKAEHILVQRKKFKDKRSNSGKVGYVCKLARELSVSEEGIDYLKDYYSTASEEERESLKNKQVLKQVLKLYINGDGDGDSNISIYDFSKQQIEKQEKGEEVDEFLLAVSHIYKLIHSVHGEILLDSLEFIKPLRKLVEDKKITDYREMWYACEWAMKDDFWQDVITSSSAFAKNYHQLVIKMRKK